MRQKITAACLVLLSLTGLALLGNLLSRELRILVRDTVAEVIDEDATNIARDRKRIASREAATFVNQNMVKVTPFPERFDLLAYSVKQAVDSKVKGQFCEFGVYKGATINFIASQTSNIIHGFDSFEGLPESWQPGFEKGTFALAELPKVANNVKLHKGWFDASLPKWKKEFPGPIAFIHMDADLYSSTKTVLDLVADRIVPGTIIQFDEFFNYPDWREHEYKAFMEFVQTEQVTFEYIGYTWTGTHPYQVAIRIVSIKAAGGEAR